MPTWAHEYAAAAVVSIGAIAGIGLTALTLPGIWLAIAIAGLAQWWTIAQATDRPPMFAWQTLAACVVIGLIGELVELFASAAGASKAGGSRRGAVLSIVGAFVGALVGTGFVPVLGTILGAAIGAGAGAVLGEHWAGRREWVHVRRVGLGAAAGRLLATVVKIALAIVIAAILIVAAFV